MAKKKTKSRNGVSDAVKTADRRMYWAFLALVVLVPLAFSRTPIEWLSPDLKGLTFDQFDLAKLVTVRVLTLVVLGFWVFKLYRARRARIRFTALDATLVAFLLFVAVSTILSIHFPTSLHGKFKRYEGLLTFINYGLLYLLALQTFYSQRRMAVLGKAIAVTGALVAVYGVLQFFGADLFEWSSLPFEARKSFSTFGNPDLLAGFLILTVSVSIGAFLESKSRRDMLLYGACSGIIAFNVITTYVRGAWIATSVLCVLFFSLVLAGYRTGRVSRVAFMRAVAILGALAVIGAGTTVFSLTLGQKDLNVVERVKSMARITEGSAGSRLEIWKAGLSMIKERPVFGLGPDTFRLGAEKYETEKYVKQGGGRTVSDNAHNYLIQLAAGPGTTAAFAFVAFTLSVVVASAISLFRGAKERFVIGAAFLAACVGYLVHLLFGISVIGSSAIFWVILGVLAGQTSLIRDREFDARSLVNQAVVGLVVLTSAVSAVYAGRMFLADYNYVIGLAEASRDPQTAIARYEKAISLYENGRYMDTLGMYYIQLYNANKDPETLKRAVDLYERSVAFEPLEGDHRVFLTNAYLVQPTAENIRLAKRELNVLSDVRPLSVPAMFFRGEIARLERDYKTAKSHFDRALSFNPRSEEALLGLARLYENTKQPREALNTYKRLVSFNPNNQTAVEAIKRLQ